jgi:hypothetical protein
VRGRWRITGIGWVVIVTLVVCALLITFGGYLSRLFGGGVGGIILLMLVSEGLSGDGDVVGSTGRKWDALRSDVPPRDRFDSAERTRRAVGRGDREDPPRPPSPR